MFTMLPDLALRITGSTACIALSAPKTFTAIIFSRSSGRICSTGSGTSNPAELIRMSTLPNALSTCSIAQNTRARSVTSQSSASALPPAWLILCASSSELHAPACEQRNLRPLFAKRKRDAVADSARRPRYDHRFVEKVSAHGSFGFPLGFAHNRHLDMGAVAWN